MYMPKTQYVTMMRNRRINQLIGKYVIICDSQKDANTVLYLQDPSLAKGRYWTKFMANARPFDTIKAAQVICDKFQYGNPRVAKIAPSPQPATNANA